MSFHQLVSSILTGPPSPPGPYYQNAQGPYTGYPPPYSHSAPPPGVYNQNFNGQYPGSPYYQTVNPQPPHSQPYGYHVQPFGVNSNPPTYTQGHIPSSNPAQHQIGTFTPIFQAGGSPPPRGPPNATFPPQMPPKPNYNSNQSSTWDTLILPGNQPSPLFTRLLNGIFNYFISTAPTHPIGFDPIKFATVFTALQYSDNNNKVRTLFIFATQNQFPSPEQFVYDVLPMFYRALKSPMPFTMGFLFLRGKDSMPCF